MEEALTGKFVLVYLIKGEMVALAPKNRKFGKKKLNGYGGQIKDDETPEDAMVRELREECTVEAKKEDLIKSVELTVIRERDGTTSTSLVHVFILNRWKGNPRESEEMGSVEWFSTDQLPWKLMINGDKKWVLTALFPNKVKIYCVELSYVHQNGSKNPLLHDDSEILEVNWLPPIIRSTIY
jgi:NADH pyrophosphatase NudC (nudix superfamily)